jgi:hypothetical protein
MKTKLVTVLTFDFDTSDLFVVSDLVEETLASVSGSY